MLCVCLPLLLCLWAEKPLSTVSVTQGLLAQSLEDTPSLLGLGSRLQGGPFSHPAHV